MAETQWLTDSEQKAWRAYISMSSQLTAHLNRQLQKDSGLSEADFAVLVNLSEAPEHFVRAFELGAVLQWEKSRLSHHLGRMEQRGLVTRQECPSDARGALFRITDEGLVAIESAAPLHVAEVRASVFDLLTPEQVTALTEIAETITENLKANQKQRSCPTARR